MPPFLFMGFFSSTRTYVASTTLNLVEDTPKVIQQSILSSVLNKSNKVVDIQNTILYSLANKSNQYYDFGKNKYVNGLPTGTSVGLVADIREVEKVIQSLYGVDTKVLSVTLDTFDPDFIATEYLRSNTDWSSETNKYTYNGQVYSFASAKVVKGKLLILGNRSFVTYPTYVVDTPYVAQEFTDELFYYVTYEDTTVVERPRYWVYLISEGTYPDLDVSGSQPVAQFYPVVPLRISNKSLTEDDLQDTELYQSSRELLSKIDLSMSELEEGVNANPDIDDVDHAYLMMGVSITSEVQGSRQYLHDFFRQLRFVSKVDETIYQEWADEDKITGAPPVNSYFMSDKTWKFYLRYNYITETIEQDVVGKVGEVVTAISPRVAITKQYEVPQGQGESKTKTITYEDQDSTLTLTKQITPTSVSKIVVSGLVSFNSIYQADMNFVVNLASAVHDEDVLMIPLDYSLVNLMSWESKNELFYDAVKIVFNAFEKVKLKWYETGFFKVVTMVLAIALAVYTGGFSALVTSLTVAASAGIVALGIVVAKSIVFSYLTKAAFKFVADELGVGIAMVLAAIAIVGGVTGSMMDLPYADALLSIGSLGVDATNAFAMADIADLTKEFTETVAAQQEELEEAKEELGLNLVQQIDPLDLFTSVGMLPMEQPSAFIERSLTTNIADISNNMITTFFDNQLTLPDLGGLS